MGTKIENGLKLFGFGAIVTGAILAAAGIVFRLEPFQSSDGWAATALGLEVLGIISLLASIPRTPPH